MAKTRLLYSLLATVLPFVTAQRQTLTVATEPSVIWKFIRGKLLRTPASSIYYFHFHVSNSTGQDIYHSGDGGLYAELIRNRAFQGSSQSGQASLTRTTDYWHAIGDVTLAVEKSSPALSDYLTYDLRMDIPAGTTGQVGFYNDGFWEFDVDASKDYAASFSVKGAYTGDVTVGFNDVSGTALSFTTIQVASTDGTWASIGPVIFQPSSTASNPNNTFSYTFDGAQLAGKSLQFNLLSVFKKTYNDRVNGVREYLSASYDGLKSTWVRLHSFSAAFPKKIP